MRFVPIDHATRTFGAPEGVDEKDCGTLIIRDVETKIAEHTVNQMWSAWEPTPKEIELLQNGGKIYLGIVGAVHPVVSLAIGNKLMETDE